jgi:hypothetical protein
MRATNRQTKPFQPARFIMILPPEFIGQAPNPDRTQWIPQGMYPTKEECQKDISKQKMVMNVAMGIDKQSLFHRRPNACRLLGITNRPADGSPFWAFGLLDTAG